MPSFQKATSRRWIGGKSRKYRELFDYGENAPNKKKKSKPKNRHGSLPSNENLTTLPPNNRHAIHAGRRGRVALGHCAGQLIESLSDEALAGCVWHAERGVGGKVYLDDLRREVMRRK